MMKDSIIQRREFLKSTAAVGTGLVILPSGVLSGANAPSNKLNVALIGVGGRGRAHYNCAAGENVVALCDVDEKALAKAAEKFPRAEHYVDWRKCLDQKGIDAVICSTTDHTHAFIANWALNRDMHVYCEKPLGNCVNEVRVVRDNWLKKKHKLATQVGTQRHAIPNFNRVRELLMDGVIGEITDVYAWGNRKIPKPGYLPAAGDPPPHLHYDLWIGPSPWHPYNPAYFRGCLAWNPYWDFGTGQIGDMGSHVMDLAWNGMDTTLPTTVQAKGDPFNPDVTPVKLESHFDMPAGDWHGPLRLHWYQGGAMPGSPRRGLVNLEAIGHGVMWKGSLGHLIADFSSRIILPWPKKGQDADLTYYKGRKEEDLIPKIDGFQKEWVDAAKGDLKTSCDFEYSGNAIETMLLGLVAYRVGKNINYDGANGRVTNSSEANSLLSREYRPEWTLHG